MKLKIDEVYLVESRRYSIICCTVRHRLLQSQRYVLTQHYLAAASAAT